MAHNYAPPIELSPTWPRPGSTASVLLKPQGIRQESGPFTWQQAGSPIQFTFNLEQVLVGTWERHIGPYCNVSRLEASGTSEALSLRLQGELDLTRLEAGHREPYELCLDCRADDRRVRLHGELSPLTMPLLGWAPCLYGLEFSRENHPPFEMARKAFLFFQGAGFAWLSDPERSRNEYHSYPPVDEGGPWIQLYSTAPFAGNTAVRSMTGGKAALASAPVVGWIADHGAYLVALAARNAFQAGIRWGPCLHSNPAGPELDMIVYFLPADLELLRDLVREDFPELGSDDLLVSQRAMWPLNRGLVLNRCEGDDLACWLATGCTWSAYMGERLWINGNAERVTSAEGVFEGQGAGLMQVAAGQAGRVNISLEAPALPGGQALSYLSVDAGNRDSAEVQVVVRVADDAGLLAQQTLAIGAWANRRLLLPLDRAATGDTLHLSLAVQGGQRDVRLVLDNVRGFASPCPPKP